MTSPLCKFRLFSAVECPFCDAHLPATKLSSHLESHADVTHSIATPTSEDTPTEHEMSAQMAKGEKLLDNLKIRLVKNTQLKKPQSTSENQEI